MNDAVIYSNIFTFDLLITCKPSYRRELSIKTIKHDKWERSYDGIVENIIIDPNELRSFVLPTSCWIENLDLANVISIAPIK